MPPIPPTKYFLDSSTLIQAHRTFYAHDICPGFWVALEYHGKLQTVLSIDRVRDELREGKDWLAEWAGTKVHYQPTGTSDIASAYGRAMAWANSATQFTRAAKSEFASVADGWLVAAALAAGGVVVTQEKSSPNSKNRVLIPDACAALSVQYEDIFSVMRKLAVQLSWQA